MSILTRNEFTKEHILDPANCHCSFRRMITNTTAEAICNDSVPELIKSKISWRHKDKETIITWIIPIGATFSRTFRHDATTEEIDAIITDGFVEMDAAWQQEDL